ncbi:MAG: hypothetical protein KBT27_03145, partial [Prevotellaceae bacterium]|nr:hypothetical protein [Candidatus Faecinaster equi]
IQDNSLKTALNPEGVDVTWSEGDQFAVHNKNDYNFTLASGAGTKVGTFKPSTSFTISKSNNFLAYYPGEGVNVTKEASDYSCSYYEKLMNQNQGKAILPMVFRVASGTPVDKIEFSHVFGVLRFNVKGSVSDLTKIVLETSEDIKSGVLANFAATAVIVLKPRSGFKTITYNINEGNKATSFDIVLPPATYSNITIKIYKGDEVVKEFSGKTLQINAGGITKINALISGYVDLGLSVLWATCNVGATSPEQVGDHFAWGETETKGEFEYSWSKYKYGSSSSDLTKYNVTEGVLESVDDAATVNWGSGWRTPTKTEWDELINNTNKSVVDVGGKSCIKFTSTVSGYTAKSITIPYGGIYNGESGLYNATNFYYWTSTISAKGSAYRVYTNSGSTTPSASNCAFFYGLPVRPVHGK